MRNFRQIAEDCLAGKLSGTFILRDGSKVNSHHLKKLNPSKHLMCSYSLGECWISNDGNAYGETGYLHKVSIINFIPDMKKEQITIDIPEGMEAVQETVYGEIRIKFVEKKLTYEDIFERIDPKLRILPFATPDSNTVNDTFFDKVNVLRKLTNIRNYFGKLPKSSEYGWVIGKDGLAQEAVAKYPHLPMFATKDHAEQAIKILGDELKYLFEPW